MRKPLITTAILALAALVAQGAHAARFRLKSAEISNGATIKKAQVYNSFGCTGDNISPSLSWAGAPKGTKSFAIMVHDPDAPTGAGWWHWVVFNIPASTTAIPKDAGDVKKNLMPAGAIQSRTDFGTGGYGGPCPPKGERPHHYHFMLFALDEEKLQYAKDDTAMPDLVGFELHFHTLAKASLIGLFGRPK